MKEQIKNLIYSLKNKIPCIETINEITVKLLQHEELYHLFLNDKITHSGSKQHLLKILKEWLNDKRELKVFENLPLILKK